MRRGGPLARNAKFNWECPGAPGAPGTVRQALLRVLCARPCSGFAGYCWGCCAECDGCGFECAGYCSECAESGRCADY